MKRVQDEYLVAGDRYTIKFACTEQDGVTPLNLAGSTLKWRLATKPGEVAELEKTPTVTNATGGLCQVELVKVDTEDIIIFEHVQQLLVIDGASEEFILAQGAVFISAKIGAPA